MTDKQLISLEPGVYVLVVETQNPSKDRRAVHNWTLHEIHKQGMKFIVQDRKSDVRLMGAKCSSLQPMKGGHSVMWHEPLYQALAKNLILSTDPLDTLDFQIREKTGFTLQEVANDTLRHLLVLGVLNPEFVLNHAEKKFGYRAEEQKDVPDGE